MKSLESRCAWKACGREFTRDGGPGRPKQYCSPLCRQNAATERRAERRAQARRHTPNAVAVRLETALRAVETTTLDNSTPDLLAQLRQSLAAIEHETSTIHHLAGELAKRPTDEALAQDLSKACRRLRKWTQRSRG